MRYPVKAVTLFTSISMALGANAAVMIPELYYPKLSRQFFENSYSYSPYATCNAFCTWFLIPMVPSL
jgi:hypothetical protein